MRSIKYTILACLFLMNIGSINAQTATLTISSPTPVGQYQARDKVELKTPSGKIIANATTGSRLFVDNNMILPVVYSNPGSNGVNPVVPGLNLTRPVGSIPYTYNVTPIGSASCNIPIFIPIGTNGIQPGVSLSYSSLNPLGQLGCGWDISGISEISRSNQTIYHNANVRAVDLTNADVFNMDGNRLIPVTGTNGASGTIYSTESETFSRITSSGTIGNGPQSFSVETKDGMILEYGKNADARLIPVGQTTVLTWKINKMSDAHGNYILFNYNNLNGEVFIKEILYTGTTSFLPYNSIKFYYDSKQTTNSTFVNGGELNQTTLLRAIEIKSDGIFTKQYNFRYSQYHVNYFLTEVEEVGSDYTVLNPLKFGYDADNAPSAATYSITKTPTSIYRSKDVLLDFTGDGKKDLVSFNYDVIFDQWGGSTTVWFPWASYKNIGNSTFQSTSTNNTYPAGFSNFDAFPASPSVSGNMLYDIVDFNGDSKEDLVMLAINGSGSTRTLDFDARISNGTTFASGGTPISLSTTDKYKYWYADVNGDLKTDLVVYSYSPTGTSDLYVYYDFSSAGSYHVSYTGTNNPDLRQSMVLDLDGDGICEFPNITYPNGPSGNYILKFIGGVASFVADNSGTAYVNLNYAITGNVISMYKPFCLFGDFNGDGKSDNIYYKTTSATTSEWKIALGKGNGVCKDILITSIFPVLVDNKFFMVHDINKDGKTDILEFTYVSGVTSDNVKVYYSTGLSFISENFIIDMSAFSGQLGDLNFGDFNGDGTDDLYIGGGYYPAKIFYFNRGAKSNNIDEIYDGYGKDVKFDFAPLTSGGSLYTKTAGFTYPLSEFQNALYVVSQTSISDGIGGTAITTYNYEDAVIHKQGKGLIGFKKMTAIDLSQDAKAVQSYNFNSTFFNLFPVSSAVSLNSTSTPVSTSTFQNTTVSLSAGKRYYSKTDNVTIVNHVAGFTKIQDYVYNSDGNLTSSTINMNASAEVTEVANTYIQKGAWMPNKLASSQQTTTRTGELPYVRKIDHTYNTFGDVINSTSDIGTTKSVSTDFVNDANTGVRMQSTVSSGALASVITHWDYDSKFRCVLKSYNPLNQIVEYTYDRKWCKPLTVKGIDGLITEYNFDAFGRHIYKKTPDGNDVSTSYDWVQSGEVTGTEPINVSNALHKTTILESGKPFTKTIYDSFGRVLKKETEGFNNNTYKVFSYDSRGRLYKESSTYQTIVGNPYTALISTSTYNAYNQPTLTVTTDGTIYQNSYTAYSYSGGNMTTTSTSPDNKISTITTDATSVTIGASDGGGTLVYEYYSNRKPKRINLNGVQMNYMEYDELANKSKLTDKDAGTILYTYNAYNQLVSRTDANGQTISYTYDGLNRQVTKTNSTGTYNYFYVASGHGINQLLQTVAPNGLTTTYSYDNLNRNTQISESISGNIFSTAYEHDQYNNITKITYPSSFAIKKAYNSKGFLTDIKRADNSNLIWQRDEVNPLNQESKFTLGNQIQSVYTYNNFGNLSNMYASGVQNLDLQFNVLNGNLNYRTDNMKTLTENFTYDNLNRLTQSLVAGSSVPIDVTYNLGGSITQKTDIGTTSFHTPKVHATETATNPNTNISLTQQNVTYTPFNKAQTIIEGDYQYNLTYGTNDERRKTELYYQGSLASTKFYHINYEKEVTPTNTREVHYIHGPQGLSAMYVIDNGVGTMNYVYTDHLGSINTITDQSGNIVTEQNFDAWGRKRNTSNWTYSSIGSTPGWLYRGYTGHEHLPQFALINMNGRMYDPLLSSMLSPDPYNQKPNFTQNYNRYGYTYNNPLKYADPSGNFSILQTFIRGYISGYFSTGTNRFAAAWKEASRRTENNYKIVGGLFTGSKQSNGVVDKVLHQTFSTFVGFHMAQFANDMGDVDNVSWKDGATVLTGKNDKIWWGESNRDALTIGSYIYGNNTMSNDPNNTLFQHEYGNVLLSHHYGELNVLQWGNDRSDKANYFSFYHFAEKDGSGNVIAAPANWDFDKNRIPGYDPNLPVDHWRNKKALTDAGPNPENAAEIQIISLGIDICKLIFIGSLFY